MWSPVSATEGSLGSGTGCAALENRSMVVSITVRPLNGGNCMHTAHGELTMHQGLLLFCWVHFWLDHSVKNRASRTQMQDRTCSLNRS